MRLSVLDTAHIPQVRAKNESTVSVGLLVAHLSFPNPILIKYSTHSMRRYGIIKLSLVEYPIQFEYTNIKTVVKSDFTYAYKIPQINWSQRCPRLLDTCG